MKTTRFLLAAALLAAAAACSGDITAPESARPASGSASAAAPPSPAGTETDPEQADGGYLGSGGGK